MKTILLFFFVLTVVVFSQASNAAFVATPTVDGLSGGTYKPLSIPALTGTNFQATGKVLINGKLVPIPGYIPPASTAAQAAKTSLWSNPLLVGAFLLGWAEDAGLSADVVNHAWIKTVAASGGDPSSTAAMCYLQNMPGTGYASNADLACDEVISLQSNYCPTFNAGGSCVSAGSLSSSSSYVYGQTTRVWNGSSFDLVDSNITVTAFTEGPLTETPTTAPATEADFNALPSPPPEALAELAPQVGVPVDSPVFEPADIAVGDPFTRPDGSTAEPRAKISPQSDGKVAIDTYDLPLTTPTGDPVTNPTPQDTTEAPPSESQCDKYPGSLGCANLDQPTAENLGSELRDIASITPVAVGGPGSCPAPLTGSFLGQPIEFSLDPLCTYANALRPLVLSLAWLSAGVIFIGGVRNG